LPVPPLPLIITSSSTVESDMDHFPQTIIMRKYAVVESEDQRLED